MHPTLLKIEMKLVNSEQYNVCFRSQTPPLVYTPLLPLRPSTLVRDTVCVLLWWAGMGAVDKSQLSSEWW